MLKLPVRDIPATAEEALTSSETFNTSAHYLHRGIGRLSPQLKLIFVLVLSVAAAKSGQPDDSGTGKIQPTFISGLAALEFVPGPMEGDQC